MPSLQRPAPPPRAAWPVLAVAAALAAVAAVLVLLRRRSRGAPHGLEFDGPAGDPAGRAGGTPDDAIILARVESMVLGDPAVPKGDIVVDAVGGVVTLRGGVPEEVREGLPGRVAGVPGVVRVESLLHAPGRPPAG
ncbi:MAG: BON domain-containing protein [Thermoleophilia bacterium]